MSPHNVVATLSCVVDSFPDIIEHSAWEGMHLTNDIHCFVWLFISHVASVCPTISSDF